jgi:hypothetical protein
MSTDNYPDAPIEDDPRTADAIDDEVPVPGLATDPNPVPDLDTPVFRSAGDPEPVYRTGVEQQWDPADLAVARGWDPTPENIERARQELAEEGATAIEKTVP